MGLLFRARAAVRGSPRADGPAPRAATPVDEAAPRAVGSASAEAPVPPEAAPGPAGPPTPNRGDIEPQFFALYERCRKATMTSVERMYALYQAVSHVERRRVRGDIVECGVWRGGSMMLAAMTLAEAGSSDRRIWLYDTFDGMPEPSSKDVSYRGESAIELWREFDEGWCLSPLDEVMANMRATGYPPERIEVVPGMVQDTIPGRGPDQIAVLRLDTDWYDSTYHELTHLFPRLADNGVLIIDDYGHWRGSREATDRYFAEHGIDMLLQRIDYTGRMGVHRRRDAAAPPAGRMDERP